MAADRRDLSAAIATAAIPAAMVSGSAKQPRAREGAAPGLGDIPDTAPHVGLAGTPKAGRILHRLWFTNMSVASTTALAAQGQPQGPQSHASWFIIAVIWASSASCLAKISCR